MMQAISREKMHREQLRVDDNVLILTVFLLLGLGVVMVLSSSIALAHRHYDAPLYFFWRQCIALSLGGVLAFFIIHMPVRSWQIMRMPLFLIGLLLLVFVLLPGIGRDVNGSLRWLSIGGFSLQPSEFMKFFFIIYMADYLARQQEILRTRFIGFFSPMLVLMLISILLLLEPDFGGILILCLTALAMMFIAGVPLVRFLFWLSIVILAIFNLLLSSPYRFERLTSFIDPWQDPYGSGFQLTQALISLARADGWGVGIGAGIQKLFYLPEAHTDFMFVVLVEELGLLWGLIVILAFACLIWRAFLIARVAEQADYLFSAYLAYGIGLLIGLQAYCNIAVNMGLLPTKGLTLPLMSYGGSSLLVNCILLAVLFRINRENRSVYVREGQS